MNLYLMIWEFDDRGMVAIAGENGYMPPARKRYWLGLVY